MSASQAASQIQLTPMPQLVEALDGEDDWTGLTDAASRRKRQNRLNVRAYRRRKALKSQGHSAFGTGTTKTEPEIPCWVERQQAVSILPASVANALNSTSSPLIPYQPAVMNPATSDKQSSISIIFPLSSDHLITLLQYNVLRGCMTNRRLLSGLDTNPVTECSVEAVRIPPTPSFPHAIPPTLQPTYLQRTVPHEEWIDIIPHPIWRDNVIRASGNFDEDELWSDTIGGLFEGFPGSEVERRGVILWSPPWHVSGWEISEGFGRKWGWSLKGCGEVLEATNRWRRERGEEPLVLEV